MALLIHRVLLHKGTWEIKSRKKQPLTRILKSWRSILLSDPSLYNSYIIWSQIQSVLNMEAQPSRQWCMPNPTPSILRLCICQQGISLPSSNSLMGKVTLNNTWPISSKHATMLGLLEIRWWHNLFAPFVAMILTGTLILKLGPLTIGIN